MQHQSIGGRSFLLNTVLRPPLTPTRQELVPSCSHSRGVGISSLSPQSYHRLQSVGPHICILLIPVSVFKPAVLGCLGSLGSFIFPLLRSRGY